MKKLILFDFDGTIVDSLKAGVDIINANAEKYGVKRIKDIDAAKGMSFGQFCKTHNISPLKVPFFLMHLKKKINSKIDSLPVFEGMVEVIYSLHKEYNLGILSSNSKKNILTFLKAHNLENLFKFIISSPHLFLKSIAIKNILKKEKLKIGDVLYIGDEVRDVKACKKVDVPIIAVSWGYNSFHILQNAKPNYLVSEPKKILEIVSKHFSS
jgi:phosphoglycolate phosphatase